MISRRSGRNRSAARSKAEHMIETERAGAADEPMIAEEAAGLVADNDVGSRSRSGAGLLVEHRMIVPEPRTRARYHQIGVCDLVSAAVIKSDDGRARRQPWTRHRID